MTFMVHNVTPHNAAFWDPAVARFALHWGDHFVVHSEHQRLLLHEMLPRAQVDLVPHPPYPMFTGNRQPKASAKFALGVAPGVPTLLFFGMVRAYKGLPHVIRAVGILKEAGFRMCLIIAGEFWTDKSQYVELIDDLNLKEDVIIDDRYVPNEQVALYFSAADILAVPYIGGTQSGVAAIASSFGLPIIVTEHIRSGIYQNEAESIHVVPPGSPEAIAEVVQRIANSPGRASGKNQDDEQGWQRLVQAIISITEDAPSQRGVAKS